MAIQRKQTLGLITGLCLFILTLIAPDTEALPTPARHVLAVALLMASWWISEAIPIAATALMPIFLFPLLGVMPGSEVTKSYAHHLIYLFLGGFLIAVTIEKWNLHKRIALHTIKLVGIEPDRIILGFMIATAGLSMWISNTAATMMMITIGMAVLKQVSNEIEDNPELNIDTRPQHFQFGIALMLSIAYAASIGGIATLIGTPPNAIMAGIIEEQFSTSISFGKWMLFALPLSVTLLLACWLYLTRFAFRSEIKTLPGGKQAILDELQQLGAMSRQELSVLLVFISVALLWIGRGIFELEAFAYITDSTIAMAGALLLFIIPAGKGEFLLDWNTASKIPWDILILFGGGFALASGFIDSGLTGTIALQLQGLQEFNVIWLLLATIAVVIILTEITSNTATASMFLPVVVALALAVSIHPYCLMAAVALAASCAFMLPVATPPNAIAYSSRYFTITQMTRTGIWMNVIGLILITLFIVIYMPVAWDISLDTIPADLSKVMQNNP